MPEFNIDKFAERHYKMGALLLRNRDPLSVGCREGRFSLMWAVGFYVFLGLSWSPHFWDSFGRFLVSFVAWWGVSLTFAVSGLRRGGIGNRIYAGISLALFFLFVIVLLRAG